MVARMIEPDILLAEDAGVATIVLNRPGKLNAFAGDMREHLLAALEQVAARPHLAALGLAAGAITPGAHAHPGLGQ